nr:hypothetical protein [Heliobacterium chlorum]
MKTLIDLVKSKYSIDKPDNKVTPLWENLKESFGVTNKDAWRLIRDFIGEAVSVMFFNQSDEKIGFVFRNGNDVVCLLSETYGFEFYLTNRDAEYLI